MSSGVNSLIGVYTLESFCFSTGFPNKPEAVVVDVSLFLLSTEGANIFVGVSALCLGANGDGIAWFGVEAAEDTAEVVTGVPNTFVVMEVFAEVTVDPKMEEG